jgi:hypothetical protein
MCLPRVRADASAGHHGPGFLGGNALALAGANASPLVAHQTRRCAPAADHGKVRQQQQTGFVRDA